MKKLCILWLACGLAPVLSAQQPTPPPLPPGPLLNKAPDFAQWTITSKASTDPADAESPGAQPPSNPSPAPTSRHKPKPAESSGKPLAPSMEQTTVVTKTQSIRHEETSTGTGPKVERWCIADMQVTTNGTAAPVVSLPGGTTESNYVDYAKTDFPGFEWIDAHNFTGLKKVMGQDCLVFHDASPTNKGAAPAVPIPKEAAINAATRLPVTLQVGEEIQTYEFAVAPIVMLALPPEVESVVEQWRKTMSQSALTPAKP